MKCLSDMHFQEIVYHSYYTLISMSTDDDWMHALEQDSSSMHIVKPLTFSAYLYKCTVKDTYMPQ
jgi:hypothetical protein